MPSLAGEPKGLGVLELTLKVEDVTEVRPVDVNSMVWFPVPEISRSVNVATPLTAFTEVVPESVPEPDVMAAATVAELEVTVFPDES